MNLIRAENESLRCATADLKLPSTWEGEVKQNVIDKTPEKILAAAVREVTSEHNLDMKDFDDDPTFCDIPAMPRGTRPDVHRPISPLAFMNACVARPVTRKEASGNAKAKAAMDMVIR